MEYVVGRAEASAKPTTLKKKDAPSAKSVLIWQLSHTFDQTGGHMCEPELNTAVSLSRYFIARVKIQASDSYQDLGSDFQDSFIGSILFLLSADHLADVLAQRVH